MSSVVLSGDTSGAITLAAPAVAGTNTITMPANTGTLALTSDIPAGSMTLLGTITVTAVNSVSLSGLNLTGYKSLYIVFNNINNNTVVYVSSSNLQSGGGLGGVQTGGSGTAWLDLGTGAIGGGYYANTINTTASLGFGGLTNVSTSSTTIYFRETVTNTFGAQGTIVIYGVK